MKKKFLYLFLFPFFFLIISNDNCDVTSHSYFWVRAPYQVGSPEFIAHSKYQHRQTRKSPHHFSIQATLFGGESIKPHKIGKFFMPFGSSQAAVNGNLSESDNALFPQNFNIPSVRFSPMVNAMLLSIDNLTEAYQSTIQVNPKQSIIGLGLSYEHLFCICDREYWLNLSAPILHVRNTMGLQETQPTGGLYDVPPITGEQTNLNNLQTTMMQALSQSGWQFGKIDDNTHYKTRLAFIQLYGGATFLEEHCYELKPYVGIIIPTGNTPKAEFVFEPIAGNGNHFGFLWGSATELFLWHNCDHSLEFSYGLDITMQYLLSKTQKRSLDLKNKPWSRYIELYANPAQSQQASNLQVGGLSLSAIFLNTPGINILTQDVVVKPGFNIALNTALMLTQYCGENGFNVEAGYNFYAKQAECLNLKRRFETEAAIKDHVGSGLTNPVRDITNNLLLNEASFANLVLNGNLNTTGILNSYDRAIIQETDLDLSSAAHPCILSHTVYGMIGYHWDESCYPVITSIGGSYEFPSKNNTALNRWLLWGKFGISF
ncbi:MAG: hypothetical protein WDZ41_00370 [Candidatus Babeliales bacterium]